MKKLLISCPPMIENISFYEDYIISSRFEYHIPNSYPEVSYDELYNICHQYDAWIAGDDIIDAKLLQQAGNGKLKALIKWGVGTDNIDILACKENKIYFSNTPSVFNNEVADLAICYLISLNRQIFNIHKGVVSGHWPKITGRSIQGRKIGILGLGDIGKTVAKRLTAFEVEGFFWDPNQSLDNFNNFIKKEWPNSLDQCDDLIITCALNKSTQNIIDKGSISLMKKGINIINVSRGGLIKTKDLILALTDGQINSVALDVFEKEPINKNSPLLKFENCIFGSHNASNTLEAVVKVSKQTIDLSKQFLQA